MVSMNFPLQFPLWLQRSALVLLQVSLQLVEPPSCAWFSVFSTWSPSMVQPGLLLSGCRVLSRELTGSSFPASPWPLSRQAWSPVGMRLPQTCIHIFCIARRQRSSVLLFCTCTEDIRVSSEAPIQWQHTDGGLQFRSGRQILRQAHGVSPSAFRHSEDTRPILRSLLDCKAHSPFEFLNCEPVLAPLLHGTNVAVLVDGNRKPCVHHLLLF